MWTKLYCLNFKYMMIAIFENPITKLENGANLKDPK